MKIGFDARFLTHPQVGGFKTYTTNLIAALAEVDRENEYVLYVDRPITDATHIPPSPNFVSRIISGSGHLLGMPWREQVGLVRAARRDRIDLLHSPALTAPLYVGCCSVVTIHDMIWSSPRQGAGSSRRSLRRRLMQSYYEVVPRYAARRASAIITVSHVVRRDIIRQLSADPESVHVTYEAPHRHFRRRPAGQVDHVRRMRDLPPAFVLAIGSADPRKNVGTLIRAYALLPPALRTVYRLVVVMTHSLLASELTRQVEVLGLAKHVHLLDGVTDEDLVLIYHAASLFVFPSVSEGFGLPVLEAMACGTPVVASDTTSIPEIAGDAALLVDPLDTAALADAMSRCLTDDAVRSRLIRAGSARAAMFSWERCARETIDVYQQAVGEISRARLARHG